MTAATTTNVDPVDPVDPNEAPILNACSAGDVATLRLLLATATAAAAASTEHAPTEQILRIPPRWSMLSRAVKSGSVETVRYVLARDPDLPSDVAIHMLALDGGPAIYEVFLERYPDLFKWDLGHMGDALGLSAVHGDVPFVTLLLDKGADIENSHYFHQPVRHPQGHGGLDTSTLTRRLD